MLHPEVLRQQAVVGAHHVVVRVLRQWARCTAAGAVGVAGLAGLPVADAVAQDEEELLRVERLPGVEELAGKVVGEELGAGAAGAVQDEDSVAGVAVGDGLEGAEGLVV